MKFWPIAILFLVAWLAFVFVVIAFMDSGKKADERIKRFLAKKANEETEHYQDRLSYESEQEKERTENLARDKY